MDGPLVFLHLPKTAGTTFNLILRRQFAASRIVLLRAEEMAENIAALRAMPEAERHRIQLLRGHQLFGLHELLAPGARYLTILRHPVSRLVSHYNYVVATEHPMFIDAIRGGEMSLHDYVTSTVSGELENGQTRWIAGIDDDRTLGAADLAVAQRHIEEHFAWVGVTEHFDESMVDLAITMRWPKVHYRRRNVASSPRDPIPTRTVDAILERNALDLTLHTEAVARLRDHGPASRAARSVAGVALRGAGRLLTRLDRPA